MRSINDRRPAAEEKQKDFIKMINKAAENHVVHKSGNRKKEYISDETYKRILNKERLKKEGRWDELEKETRDIKKIIKKEKGKFIEEKMNRNLETRDKWMGIKELKQQYTPKMYERSHWNDDKKLCSREEQAEQAAIFLEKKHWGVYLHDGDEFQLAYLTNEGIHKFYLPDKE